MEYLDFGACSGRAPPFLRIEIFWEKVFDKLADTHTHIYISSSPHISEDIQTTGNSI